MGGGGGSDRGGASFLSVGGAPWRASVQKFLLDGWLPPTMGNVLLLLANIDKFHIFGQKYL